MHESTSSDFVCCEGSARPERLGCAGEAAVLAEFEHWERWPRVDLALGGDVLVSGYVVEMVAVDEDLRQFEARGERSGGILLPLADAAFVRMPGFEQWELCPTFGECATSSSAFASSMPIAHELHCR